MRSRRSRGDEPDWLRADRLAALDAFEALPVEPNQLYTPYVDLRAAELADVAPYIRDAARPGPRVASEPAGGRRRPASSSTRTASRGSLSRPRRPPRGVIARDARATSSRATRTASAPLLDGGAGPARRRQARPADARGSGTRASSSHVPAGVQLDRADRHPLGRRRARSGALIPGRSIALGDGAEAIVLEELVVVGRRAPTGAPQSLLAGTLEVTLGRDAQARGLEPPGASRARPSRSSIATPSSARARRSTGRSPSSARGSSAAGSTTASKATAARVEQVEIVFGGERPALRPDLLHPPHRPGHDRQPAVEGRAARRGPGVHEGHDRHRPKPRSGRTASSASSG